MKNERLIDIFQKMQIEKPFDFAYQNLCAAMRTFIVNGSIQTGTIFNIHRLSEALGISRTTALKSMSILLEEGWISLDDRNRYSAAKPTIQDIKDIIIFRGSLEPHIVKLVTKNATPKELSDLHRLVDNYQQIDLLSVSTDDDIRKFVTIEMSFHDKLCEMCHNSYLYNSWQINRDYIIRQIWLTYKSYFDFNNHKTAYDADYPYQIHYQLYNVIKERNEQMAMGSVYSHQRLLNFDIYKPYTLK